jgi:methionyl-tRNA formyltransferase
MKVIWLSANQLGYELLKEAVKLKGFDLKAILTLKSDAKTVMYDGIKPDKWREFGVKVVEVQNVNVELNIIKEISPELIVMCGWRQILDEKIVNYPASGTIGFHPTLLPYGRGPAPIINTILKGLKESGLTMYYVTRGLDDGDIIAQEHFQIEDNDHAGDVYTKVVRAGKELINKHFTSVLEGKASRKPQDSSKAVLFDKPRLEDNRIDPEKDNIVQIFRKIKALSKPYRGAYIEKDGKRLVLWKAELQDLK